MTTTATSSSKTSSGSISSTQGARASLVKGGGAPPPASGGGAPRPSLAQKKSLGAGGVQPGLPLVDPNAPSEPPPGPTPEELEAARIAAEEAAKLELKAAPIREYLESTVVPLLLKGLQILAVERPENPVNYLAQYLIVKNPQQPLPPPPPEVEEVMVDGELLMDGQPWSDPGAPGDAGGDAGVPPVPIRAASVQLPADATPAAIRAASLKPPAGEPPPSAPTRAASVKPPAVEPPPPAPTRAASVKPPAVEPPPPPARAASVKPAAEAAPPPVTAAIVIPDVSTRAGSIKSDVPVSSSPEPTAT